jgi:hypothetical protein
MSFGAVCQLVDHCQAWITDYVALPGDNVE